MYVKKLIAETKKTNKSGEKYRVVCFPRFVSGPGLIFFIRTTENFRARHEKSSPAPQPVFARATKRGFALRPPLGFPGRFPAGARPPSAPSGRGAYRGVGKSGGSSAAAVIWRGARTAPVMLSIYA